MKQQEEQIHRIITTMGGGQPRAVTSRTVRVERVLPASRRPPLGRNDPCVCGSGRKYKKCCKGKVPLD